MEEKGLVRAKDLVGGIHNLEYNRRVEIVPETSMGNPIISLRGYRCARSNFNNVLFKFLNKYQKHIEVIHKTVQNTNGDYSCLIILRQNHPLDFSDGKNIIFAQGFDW